MADKEVVAANVNVVFPEMAEIVSVKLDEATTAGQTLHLTAGGDYALADANVSGERQVRGIALEGGAAGEFVSMLRYGIVAGFVISGMAYDAILYQSDTAGALADGVGTVTVPVGLVVPLADSSLTKVLFFNPRNREDYT